MSVRAGIVVTGTEVLTGRVPDRNGPWLAEQLRLAGVDIDQVVIVGDRPADLRSALGYVAAEVDLVVTSGGLGPTADDLTAQVVAEFQGRSASVDAELETRIGAIVARLSTGRGWRLDPQATAAAVRKQALVPDGAEVLQPVGTAPGLVVPVAAGRSGPPVVVLPGPPRELQGMWDAALGTRAVEAALAGRSELRQRTIRIWNVPESELAAVLRDHGPELAALEITTCLRGGELEVVTRYGPQQQADYDRFVAMLTTAYADSLFSPDGRTVDRLVADALLERGATVATAESCTAGLLAGRLTDLAGSSAYVLGGLVTYSNEAKTELAGVPRGMIERVGAVSPEVAQAMASGARERLGADYGIGVTGIAGPDGGTPEKPVGLVYVHVSGPGVEIPRRLDLPGSRADVRDRTVTIALHLLRHALSA